MSLENTTWIAESVNSTNKETEKIWLLSYILYQAVERLVDSACNLPYSGEEFNLVVWQTESPIPPH